MATAALAVFSTVISLFSVVLLLAVIRRLREHEQALAMIPGTLPPTPLIAIGERIGEFRAQTVDGEPVTRDDLQDSTLVGFFDPDCDTCHEQLPGFVASAAAQPGGRSTTLAVVSEGPKADDLVRLLRDAARVAVEPARGPAQQAFGVRVYPAFCRLGRGQVVRAHRHEPGHTAAASR